MKRHRFDPLSFVFGMVFLLTAAAATWNLSLRWNINAWVIPVAVLFLGIALLASTLRSGPRDAGVDEEQRVSTTTPES
jgi:hypothetical protein